MKIKPAPKKKLNRSRAYHHWLQQEPPKASGRLSQLSKRNRRLRATILGGAKEVK